jgi:hypothetical protein
MLKLISKVKKNLTKNDVKQICILKDSEWKHGLASQKIFFEKYSKNNDLCNFLYSSNKLIGFTILRKRTYKLQNNKGKFLLLDSMLLKKRYRKKIFRELLMNFNNQIIKMENIFGILFCENKLLNFYKRYNWKKCNLKKFSIEGYNNTRNIMSFNLKNKSQKISIFVNKS